MPARSEPSFKRRLRKKPASFQKAIAECIERLVDNPRHPGLQVHPMQGHPGVWEAYVDKGNRITFHREGETLVLRNHCNHDMLRRSP